MSIFTLFESPDVGKFVYVIPGVVDSVISGGPIGKNEHI